MPEHSWSILSMSTLRHVHQCWSLLPLRLTRIVQAQLLQFNVAQPGLVFSEESLMLRDRPDVECGTTRLTPRGQKVTQRRRERGCTPRAESCSCCARRHQTKGRRSMAKTAHLRQSLSPHSGLGLLARATAALVPTTPSRLSNVKLGLTNMLGDGRGQERSASRLRWSQPQQTGHERGECALVGPKGSAGPLGRWGSYLH